MFGKITKLWSASPHPINEEATRPTNNQSQTNNNQPQTSNIQPHTTNDRPPTSNTEHQRPTGAWCEFVGFRRVFLISMASVQCRIVDPGTNQPRSQQTFVTFKIRHSRCVILEGFQIPDRLGDPAAQSVSRHLKHLQHSRQFKTFRTSNTFKRL